MNTQELHDTLLSLDGLSLAEIERHLDVGNIEASMNNKRWWRVRRNGATKRWVTRPKEFRIPVKAGLRSCAYICHHNLQHYRLRSV